MSVDFNTAVDAFRASLGSPDAPFRCATCGKWFRPAQSSAACCVMHGPGDCCHYGQQQVDEPAPGDSE